MNSNVVQFPITMADPQISTLQSIGAAYLAAWQTQHYAFLPALHQLLERHAKFFIKRVEEFHRNAERISATIRSNDLDEIIEDIQGLDDPADIAEYLTVGEDAIASIADALGKQMTALRLVLIDVAALGVYDVSRDLRRYQGELDKLDQDHPARTAELQAREAELVRLDEAIKVLEAANLQALFAGSIPSAQQLKDAASTIAAGGVSVEAVENALKQIGEMIGNALEGLRYSRILDQRRDVQKAVDELNATLRAMEQSRRDTQAYCERLGDYALLVEQREQWQAGFNQIVQQLVPVERQLGGYQVKSVASLLAVQPQISDLHAFSRKVLADFRPGQ